MSRAVVDTSAFIAPESGRPYRPIPASMQVGVSVVSLGELHAGVLAAPDLESRSARLATLTEALALEPLPIDALVAEHWARLRLALRDAGRRMPLNDSWIAATALAAGAAIITQDADYDDVPGLEVLRV